MNTIFYADIHMASCVGGVFTAPSGVPSLSLKICSAPATAFQQPRIYPSVAQSSERRIAAQLWWYSPEMHPHAKKVKLWLPGQVSEGDEP